jgi:mechanosensitive ion channel-like protein
MATTPVITDSGDAMVASVTSAVAPFFAAIPKVLAFAIILAVGWFLASLVGRLLANVLRRVRFNDLADRSGVTGFVRTMGTECDASGWLGEIAKWFIRLIAAVVAFDALGLPAVSDVLRQLLLWLPNLVVGLVVLVIGGVAARALGSLVRASTSKAGFSNPGMLGTVASVAVWAFAIVIAVQQIGVAQTLVNTLFMAVVGAMALAFGLAFGLGGRKTAAEMVRKAYQATREAKPRISEATEVAVDQARAYSGPDRRRVPRGEGGRMQPGSAFGDD